MIMNPEAKESGREPILNSGIEKNINQTKACKITLVWFFERKSKLNNLFNLLHFYFKFS